MSRWNDLASSRVCVVWIWAVLAVACRPIPGPPTTTTTPAVPEEPPSPVGEPYVPPAGYTRVFPLRTDGRFIVDANGYRFKIAGVNWYGAEGQDFVVGGLDRQPLATIVAHIRSMGFNTVRLPWSNALLATNPRVDDQLLAANPRLRGRRAMDIFDAVIDALTHEGLAVVLVNHTSDAIWCCSDHDGNGLWFNERYPELMWIEHWQRIARRYANNSAVVGAELRNELRKRCTADGCEEITWGGGGQLDWHRAATTAGNALHQVNRNLLVLVDGLNYAADLRGVYNLPIQLATRDRLVYATHDYSWFHAANVDPETHASALGNAWGYILTQGRAFTAPIVVTELGTCTDGRADCGGPPTWFASILAYLRRADIDWIYWPLNGTQMSGEGRTFGAVDFYGVLDQTWTRPASTAVLDALRELMPAYEHSRR